MHNEAKGRRSGVAILREGGLPEQLAWALVQLTGLSGLAGALLSRRHARPAPAHRFAID